MQQIDLQAGMTLSFKEGHSISLFAMFGFMVFASAAFECRPVVCREFLPKLDMRLSLKNLAPNDEAALMQAWNKVQAALLAWLDQTPATMVGQISQAGIELELFHADYPPDGVVTFTRQWFAFSQ